MADAYKVLGQANPLAATLTTLYTVPALTGVAMSCLMVCNRSSVATKFRFAIAPAGAADALQHYLYYDVEIPGNNSFEATIGITAGAADVVRVYALLATLSFSLFGIEIT